MSKWLNKWIDEYIKNMGLNCAGPLTRGFFSINIQSAICIWGFWFHRLNKLQILYYVYAPSWLNLQMWNPRIWRADHGTSASTDFGICGGARNQSPSETEGWLHSIVRERKNLTSLKKTTSRKSSWKTIQIYPFIQKY